MFTESLKNCNNNPRQLEKGDYISCQGIFIKIDLIHYQEPWEWRKAYYIEFTDTNGIYRSWKQHLDGGKASTEIDF